MNRTSLKIAISKHHNKIVSISILLFYITFFIVNLFSLTDYPYIHSDESWLSGLTRTIKDQQTFNTSEAFFDLYPRPIHGLRVIFVFIQMFFIKLLGYNVFSMRLISLIFACISLILIYKLIKKDVENNMVSLVLTTIVAFNIQFMMMSHMARQEAIILWGMLLAYYTLRTHQSKYQFIIVASIIGVCMGIHPNSFLIGCGIGLVYLYQYLNKKITLKQLLTYSVGLIFFLMVFIMISLKINAEFFNSYLSFGDSLGVINNDISRLKGLYYYYFKLFHEIGGTYNLVNIKLDLIVLFISVFMGIITFIGMFIKKSGFLSIHAVKIVQPFLMLVGINIGYFIIGRYNQTAIVFSLVFAYLTFFNILKVFISFADKKRMFKHLKGLSMLIIILLSVYQLNNTVKTITQTDHMAYETLEKKIRSTIPENSKVLANLNLDYFFNVYELFDYRNLTYLDEHQLTFADYIQKHDIEYIILPEEMSYIFNSNGKWDILYGDLDYYNSMMTYLDQHCTLIDEFESPTYGMRIAKYVDVYPWYTKIYKVSR